MVDEEPLPWMATSARQDWNRPVDAPPAPSEPTRAPAEIRTRRDARDVMSAARLTRQELAAAAQAPADAKAAALDALTPVRNQIVQARLGDIAVESLREATEGRLRIEPLRAVGYGTVADVVDVAPGALCLLPGVGEQTATRIVAAARAVRRAVHDTTPVRLDPDQRPPAQTLLLRALKRYEDIEALLAPQLESVPLLDAQLASLLEAAGRVDRAIAWLFTGGARRAAALEAAIALDEHLHAPPVQAVLSAAEAARREHDDAPLWRDFQLRAPEYYGILGEIADLPFDPSASHGHLPRELVDRITAMELDVSLLHVSLRGYQHFGAKFALAQRRGILGDEMGLGKTIEALAVMCHLAALGETHFLVICPASVLVNWTREIKNRSKLQSHHIHGADRERSWNRWMGNGGVAVTTFDTLSRFDPASAKPALVLVDEAHLIKNAATQRARAVRRWTDRNGRVLFLTGTPLENRVEEFRTLIGYLQPQVAHALRGVTAAAGPAYFRATAAPVYLRRNQEDVLPELPDRLDVPGWVEPSGADRGRYREAVASGNFMAMRQALFAAGFDAAKMARLLEIVDESAANGWKVVVFSYFRGVLETIQACAGEVHGPITGSVPPTMRQVIVDRFTATDGHAVLLSQIEAGGTGLNLQAASVVVLTEPQWKPTVEEQAIARCHRMGQTRRVHVHRLLAQGSVDERMLEILATKQQLFDDYVRRSDLKDATPDAVDISDAAASRQASQLDIEREIIEQERRRLGIGPV